MTFDQVILSMINDKMLQNNWIDEELHQRIQRDILLMPADFDIHAAYGKSECNSVSEESEESNTTSIEQMNSET